MIILSEMLKEIEDLDIILKSKKAQKDIIHIIKTEKKETDNN